MSPVNPTPVPRLLALDYGQKRTGVAISDELGMLAHPRPALKGLGQQELLRAIARLVEEESITEVVVGLPATLSGGQSEQTRAVRSFIASLRQSLTVPVVESDERLSSVQASSSLGIRDRSRSGTLDSAAAAIVLQSVLDTRRGTIG